MPSDVVIRPPTEGVLLAQYQDLISNDRFIKWILELTYPTAAISKLSLMNRNNGSTHKTIKGLVV